MRPTLFEIGKLSPAHAALVALLLGLGAFVLVWREQRLGRLKASEFGRSLAAGLGMAVLVAAALFAATRWVQPIQVRSYGVMLMLAFGAGIGIAMARAPMYRLDPLVIVDLSLFVLFGSILGARVVYILLNWSHEYARDPMSVLNVWEGGLAFHGGLIGGTVGGLAFARWRGLRPTCLIDLVAPSVAFGYVVARIGCFINGCCHGGPTNLPWGVDFLTDTVPGAVHPTQLYSALGHILVGLALLALAPRVKVPGHLGLWFLALSSGVRIVDEVTRRGYTADPFGPLSWLTQGQAASVALIIVAASWIWATRRRVGYPVPAPAPPPDARKNRRKETRT
jgi:phosphatidylglycerol:prolipoprotein diacylglycerol transferase